jgi:Tfp pilus assembly protein PilE
MTHACPECGTPANERAAVCPRCGFPMRREAFHAPPGTPHGYAAHPAPPPPRSGVSPGVLIAAIIGVGVIGVFVIGVLAALAIPRFSQAEGRAREIRGESLLRYAWAKERQYLDQNGSYASTLYDLQAKGWLPPDSAGYALLIVSSERGNLCIEAEPPTAGRTLSVGDDGVVLHAGCGEQTAAAASTHPSDEAMRVESRLLLQESWDSLAAYHQAHGRYPRAASQLEHAVTDRNALAYFWLSLHPRGDGGVCIAALPRAETTPVFLSVDEKGDLYRGPICSGEALEHFADEGSAAVPDSILER